MSRLTPQRLKAIYQWYSDVKHLRVNELRAHIESQEDYIRHLRILLEDEKEKHADWKNSAARGVGTILVMRAALEKAEKVLEKIGGECALSEAKSAERDGEMDYYNGFEKTQLAAKALIEIREFLEKNQCVLS